MRHHVAWLLAMRGASWKATGRLVAVRGALGWTWTEDGKMVVGWVDRAGASGPEWRIDEIRWNSTAGGAGGRDDVDGMRWGTRRRSAVVWCIAGADWRCAEHRRPW